MINKKGQFSVLDREILLKAVALVIARSCWGGFRSCFCPFTRPYMLLGVGVVGQCGLCSLSDLGNTCVQARVSETVG